MSDVEEQQIIKDLVGSAIRQFQSLAIDVLAARGEPTTIVRIAEILGVPTERLYAVFAGRRGSINHLLLWMHRWHAAGYPEMEMHICAYDVSITIVWIE